MKYFKKQSDIVTDQGKTVTIYKLAVDEDEKILDEWAKHLREHYCSDDDLDFLVPSTGFTNQQFLSQIKFPDPVNTPGPSVMSGDFAEILVHDYIEFIQYCYTTRTRYENKINRNSSPMGSDVLGYKCQSANSPSAKDELHILEVKAQSSESKPVSKLQNAVKDSGKDVVRLAESLNAEVQRLRNKRKIEEVRIV